MSLAQSKGLIVPNRNFTRTNYICYFSWFVFKNYGPIWLANKRSEMRSRGAGDEVTCTDLQRVISHWKRSFMEEFQILTAPIMAFTLQQISHMHLLFMWFLFCGKNEKEKISTLSALDEVWQMSYSMLTRHE
jgi:hypothetical protein